MGRKPWLWPAPLPDTNRTTDYCAAGVLTPLLSALKPKPSAGTGALWRTRRVRMSCAENNSQPQKLNPACARASHITGLQQFSPTVGDHRRSPRSRKKEALGVCARSYPTTGRRVRARQDTPTERRATQTAQPLRRNNRQPPAVELTRSAVPPPHAPRTHRCVAGPPASENTPLLQSHRREKTAEHERCLCGAHLTCRVGQPPFPRLAT
jgi:hypothetical protein